MSHRMPHCGRLVVAAALSLLCLLAVTAPRALADGEDDPAFGNVGTSFLALGEDAEPLYDADSKGAPMRPRSDQGPDGALFSAVPLRATVAVNRGGDSDFLRVVRMDASGKVSGLDGDGIVDVEYGYIRRLLDIEVLPNGHIVLVTQSESFVERGGGSGPLEIRTLDAAGNEIGDGRRFSSPDDCDSSNGQARAADVDAAGRVFAGWENCDGNAVLARYTDEDELTRVMPVDRVVEVVLGPDGRVYVLTQDEGFFGKPQRGFGPIAEVTRYATDDLDFDGDYGDEGIAGAPGVAIDMTVDPNGRAVVWADAFFLVEARGSQETWDVFRFDAGGDPDESWSGDGWAEIEHPELGDPQTCGGRGFCGSERPQVIAQGDSKVIAVGYPPDENEEQAGARGSGLPREVTDRTIIRLTAAGALDPTWDDDGVRGFRLGQPQNGGAEYLTLGPPALQGDGKLLIPVMTFSGRPARVPSPPDDLAFGLARIGLTPVTQTVQQQQASSTPAVVAARSCVSRRVFRIRLRTGRRKAERSKIKTVSVTVNGKAVPVSKGARRTARVNLRNLPKGRFIVVIRMTLADGGKVRDTRRYRTCAPKQARELPPLRTRRPRRR